VAKDSTELKRTTALKIADLVSGRIYTHDEIIQTFVVASSGGMRRSHANNALVLLSRHHVDPEQNPYEDRWEADGLFHYTGEGQVGDQSLDYRQNKTLNESDQNGISIYLFESSRDNEYVYRGEVMLAKPPYPEQAPDRDGKLRRVYKFPLRVKSSE
jgi:5-methylcytosine-specific restriction protein A